MLEGLGLIGIFAAIVLFIGLVVLIIKTYHKVDQGKALIKNGWGGTSVSFGGMLILPILHRAEVMDISVKRIPIERLGRDGLICKDNMRADIKVAFFVRVNKTVADVAKVAEALGVSRASDRQAMIDLFDAKFSEALKTVGKKFDFVDLYKERAEFKDEILQIIGTDLNGFVLDDCAIDYLEQTDISNLSADNILDSEGIKKIIDLTAQQKVQANQIERDQQKTIKRQNVEAEEAILEMDRHLAESQEKQKREIAAIKSRETAEALKVAQEELLKSESARLITEEELAVAEENKQRQIIVAQKNKARTDAVETERIEKDRLLEVVERERIVDLAKIEKERAIETERKSIQDVIRERIVVEKAVVEEEEKIKDTRALAEAERTKNVAVTAAEQEAEESRVKSVKLALADKEAAAHNAEQRIIEAEASQKASDKNAEARKVLADAQTAEEAAPGLALARVKEAQAHAHELEGTAEAEVIRKKAEASAMGKRAEAEALTKIGESEAGVLEAKAVAQARGMEAHAAALQKQGEAKANVLRKELAAQAEGTAQQGETDAMITQKMHQAEAMGLEARADALEKQGTAEANNMLKRFRADAQGIHEKAEAMKLYDEAGRGHEEFKMNLDKVRTVELAEIENQRHIAAAQAQVIQEGLKAANIEIIGGDSMFFDRIMESVTRGKSLDRMVGASEVLGEVKNTFFNGDPDYFKNQLKQFIGQFNMSSEDVKNLSLSALINQMRNATDSDQDKGMLGNILNWAQKLGLDNSPLGKL